VEVELAEIPWQQLLSNANSSTVYAGMVVVVISAAIVTRRNRKIAGPPRSATTPSKWAPERKRISLAVRPHSLRLSVAQNQHHAVADGYSTAASFTVQNRRSIDQDEVVAWPASPRPAAAFAASPATRPASALWTCRQDMQGRHGRHGNDRLMQQGLARQHRGKPNLVANPESERSPRAAAGPSRSAEHGRHSREHDRLQGV